MLDLSKAAQDMDHLDTGVAKMAWDIVSREGGYVDDKDDAGGATNHGVSLVHARAQGKAFDLNHDGTVDADDIRLVTPEIAVVDFIEVFFIEPQLNKLPASIQACAFDHSVNGGPSASIRLVQTAINHLGVKSVTVDGQLGPNTLFAALETDHRCANPTAFLDALVDARDAEYRAIAARKPETAKFLKGWLARAESFRK